MERIYIKNTSHFVTDIINNCVTYNFKVGKINRNVNIKSVSIVFSYFIVLFMIIFTVCNLISDEHKSSLSVFNYAKGLVASCSYFTSLWIISNRF